MPFTINANNLHYVTTQKKNNYSIIWDLCIENTITNYLRIKNCTIPLITQTMYTLQ